jgi:hypothetical protein
LFRIVTGGLRVGGRRGHETSHGQAWVINSYLLITNNRALGFIAV